MGAVKVDIIAASCMLFHPAESMPGATMVDGKLKKPPGWTHTAQGIHKLIKGFASMRCILDIAAIGAATCTELGSAVDELWIRNPMRMGADKPLTMVCVLMWTCNDVAIWFMGKAGKKKGVE